MDPAHYIDKSSAIDILESPYYKRLQQELRQKRDKVLQQKKIIENVNDPTIMQQLTEKTEKEETKNVDFNDEEFKDKVMLSTKELYQEIETKQPPTPTIEQEKLVEEFKYNGKKIMSYLGHKIDFKGRENEFKEMFKFNIQESKSHNVLVSKFASFKVGIVGQILSAIGVEMDEIKQLKRESLKELFDENCEEVGENIYNAELSEIVNGRTRKNKKTIQMFSTLQSQLIQKMNNLGRFGFWSKSRLIEEKLNQCKRIHEEFMQEKQHLTYLLDYIEQKESKKAA